MARVRTTGNPKGRRSPVESKGRGIWRDERARRSPRAGGPCGVKGVQSGGGVDGLTGRGGDMGLEA